MKFGEARSKIANMYPNLQAWLLGDETYPRQDLVSESFQRDLQPLIAMKETMQQLEIRTAKLHYMIQEIRPIIKKS